jgi:hypothetical protein
MTQRKIHGGTRLLFGVAANLKTASPSMLCKGTAGVPSGSRAANATKKNVGFSP